MAKGAVYNVIEIIRYAIMTAIVVTGVVGFVLIFVQLKSDTRATRVAVYDELLLYGDGGFHIYDARTGHSLPLSVDSSRFDNATINAMLSYPDNKFIGARLVLTDLQTGQTSTAYWNKHYYDLYKPLTGKTGPGATLSVPFNHQVLLKTPSGYHSGLLTVEMVTT